jgi:mRNA interferase RelE/StbE
VKAAIDAIAATPEAGEPLRGELEKYRKYRVRRYRLVYEVDRRARLIRILALGHRRDVYEDFAARLKNL